MIARRIIRADLSQDLNNLYFLSNQYDDYSRKYRVIITNNGVLQPFTEQKPIRLVMRAEGESAPYYDDYLKSDEWEDGFPVVTFTASMLSKVGNVDFQFIISEPGSPESVSTRQQHLKIQKSLIDYDGIIASEEFNFLKNLVAQAETIPSLITDITTTKEEVDALVISVNEQMATYQTEFNTMSQNVQDLMTAVTAYMSDVENAAAASAREAESYTHGGTGTRTGEDTDNGLYYNQQSQTEADRAKTEADRAATYASMTAPNVYIDWDNMTLVQSTDGTGITLHLDDDKVLSFDYT